VSGEVLKPISVHNMSYRIDDPLKLESLPPSVLPWKSPLCYSCQIKHTHTHKAYRSTAIIIFSRHKGRRLMTSSLLQTSARDTFLLLPVCRSFLPSHNEQREILKASKWVWKYFVKYLKICYQLSSHSRPNLSVKVWNLAVNITYSVVLQSWKLSSEKVCKLWLSHPST
jgi:hypothetical protein